MRQLAFLLALMIVSFAGHAGDAAHFVQRALDLHGVIHRYQVFVPDGWTATGPTERAMMPRYLRPPPSWCRRRPLHPSQAR